MLESDKLTRAHPVCEKAAEDSTLKTYHVNGFEVSSDPAVAIEALENEVGTLTCSSARFRSKRPGLL